MKTDWISELNGLKNEQAKIAKKIGLLEEIIRLEGQHVETSQENSKTKRVARTRSNDGGGKQMKLPDLLEQIGQQHSHPMKYDVFAQFVQESGYKTNAANLNNMVYQCLQKLVKKKVFQKNNETREYQYIGVDSEGVSSNEIGRHSAVDDDFDDHHEDKPSRKSKKIV